MRDESKAAIVCLVLVLAPATLAIFHREIWLSESLTDTLRRPSDDSLPPGRFDEFIARYGPPTFEEPTESGTPHPLLFTRWLRYEPEQLRVAFVAAQSPEDNSRNWVLIAFLDSKSTQPVSPRDAGNRLMSRQKQM